MRNGEYGKGLKTWALLALLLVITRFGHLGHGLGMFDASWAVFLLGGAFLGGTRALVSLCALSGVVDVVAFALGMSTECMSAGYLSLLPAYAALWGAGRLSGEGEVRQLPRVALAAVAGSVAAFAITNAGYFLFAPSLAGMSVRTYALTVSAYLPSYVILTLAYTLSGHLIVHTGRAALRHFGRAQHDDAAG